MNRAMIYTLKKKYNEYANDIYFGEKKYNEQGNDKYFGEKVQ